MTEKPTYKELERSIKQFEREVLEYVRNEKEFKRAKPDWYHSTRRYERPHLWKAIWQLLNTFIPYFLLCILM
jgi:hypothetical protein